MFCKKCGADIADGARFCKKCGAEQSAPAQQPVQQYQQPVAQVQYAYPQGYAQPKKKKTGLIVGLIAGGVAVVALVVILIVVFAGGSSGGSGGYYGEWKIESVYGTDCSWSNMTLSLTPSYYQVKMGDSVVEHAEYIKYGENSVRFDTGQIARMEIYGDRLTMYLDNDEYIKARRQ